MSYSITLGEINQVHPAFVLHFLCFSPNCIMEMGPQTWKLKYSVNHVRAFILMYNVDLVL